MRGLARRREVDGKPAPLLENSQWPHFALDATRFSLISMGLKKVSQLWRFVRIDAAGLQSGPGFELLRFEQELADDLHLALATGKQQGAGASSGVRRRDGDAHGVLVIPDVKSA
jgi:hypothetical protein